MRAPPAANVLPKATGPSLARAPTPSADQTRAASSGAMLTLDFTGFFLIYRCTRLAHAAF